MYNKIIKTFIKVEVMARDWWTLMFWDGIHKSSLSAQSHKYIEKTLEIENSRPTVLINLHSLRNVKRDSLIFDKKLKWQFVYRFSNNLNKKIYYFYSRKIKKLYFIKKNINLIFLF